MVVSLAMLFYVMIFLSTSDDCWQMSIQQQQQKIAGAGCLLVARSGIDQRQTLRNR